MKKKEKFTAMRIYVRRVEGFNHSHKNITMESGVKFTVMRI